MRDLGLPRDALVNVIVRGGEAIPPRGSTRVEAGDRLHVLIREEVAGEFPELLERWRRGPWKPPPPRRPGLRASSGVFSSRPWTDTDGDPGRPTHLIDVPVIEHLRTRRDTRGALVALEDGRYAVSGPLLAIGS